MIINVDASIQAIYFVELPFGVLIAAVNQNTDDTVTLRYRWHYYRDTQAFSSDDHKSCYTATSSDLQGALETVRELISKMKNDMGAGKSYEILRGTGTLEQFMDQQQGGRERSGISGMSATAASYTCPKCHMVSYNPNDIANFYCGRCHQFAEDLRD